MPNYSREQRMPGFDLKKKLEDKSINKVPQTNPVLKKLVVSLINLFGHVLFLFRRNRLPKEVKKILFVSLNFNGDILFGSTLFSLVRAMYPDAELHIWIKSRAKHMMPGYPYFRKVILFNDIRTRKYDEEVNPSVSAKLNFFRELRKEKYDLAFDITGLFWTAFALFYSGVKYKAGYNFQGFGFFYNFETPAVQNGHLIDKHLSIVSDDPVFKNKLPSEIDEFRAPSFHIGGEAGSRIDNLLAENNISGNGRIIVLHTTAGWEAKKWEVSNFVELIKDIGANFQIFIIGGKEDSSNAEFISKKVDSKVYDVTGLLTMSESAELIRRAELFIGADSGPLYLAEAVGTPTLSLFGPTNPLFSAPRAAKHGYIYESLFCSAPVNLQNCKLLAGLNCRTLDCMKMITPLMVAAKAKQILESNKKFTAVHAKK